MKKKLIFTSLIALSVLPLCATNPKPGDGTGGPYTPEGCSICEIEQPAAVCETLRSIEWSVNLGSVPFYQVKNFLQSSRLGAVEGSVHGSSPRMLAANLGAQGRKSGAARMKNSSNSFNAATPNTAEALNRAQFQLGFSSHDITAALADPSILTYNFNGKVKIIEIPTNLSDNGGGIIKGYIKQVLTEDTLTHIDRFEGGFRLRIWNRDGLNLNLNNGTSIDVNSATPTGNLAGNYIYKTVTIKMYELPVGTPIGDFTFKNPNHPLDENEFDIVKVEMLGSSTHTEKTHYTESYSNDKKDKMIVDVSVLDASSAYQLVRQTLLTYSYPDDAGHIWDYNIEREVYEVSVDNAGTLGSLVKILHDFEEYKDYSPAVSEYHQVGPDGLYTAGGSGGSGTTTGSIYQGNGGDPGARRLMKLTKGYKGMDGTLNTAPPITTYDYVNNAFRDYVHGRLKSKVNPDGSWESYEYQDSRASVVSTTVAYSSWQDVTIGNRENARKITTVAEPSSVSITTEINSVKVAEEIRNTSTDPSTGDETEVVKNWDGFNWHQTTSCRFSEGHSDKQLAGRIKWIEHADGTFTVNSYNTSSYQYGTWAPGLEITSSTGAGSKTAITEGTAMVTSYNGSFAPIKEEVFDVVGGAMGGKLRSWEGSNPDALGRPQRKDFDDGTYSTAQYSCCGVSNATTRQGEILTYLRDPLKRVRKKSSQNSISGPHIFTTTTYNGLTTRTTRAAGSDILLVSETSRSLTGLLVTSKSPDADADGAPETTTRVTVNNGGSGKTTTTTYSDGTTTSTVTYTDGTTKTSTDQEGNTTTYKRGTHNEQGGGIWSQTIASNTTQWSVSYADQLGRTFKTAQADGALSTQTYHPVDAGLGSRGKLATTTDPDENVNPGSGTKVSYLYDTKGELTTTTSTIADGNILVKETETSVISDPDMGVARKTTTTVNGTLLSTSYRAVDGYASKSVSLAGTSQSSRTLPTNGAWTVTSTTPDGQSSVQTYTDARLQRTESFDNSSTPVSIAFTTYVYDDFGRTTSTTDSRTGVTTINGYLENGAVTSVTTNGGADTTSYTYSNMGRRLTTTLPDNSVTETSYTDRGQTLATWGSQTYAHLYQYDAQGRMSELRTYQDLAHGTQPTTATTGFATTQWLYNAQRGWLTEKNYDGETSNGPGNTADYTYTASGRLKTRTWERGVTTTYTYDQGSLATVAYSDTTPSVTYTYGNFGRPLTVTQAGNTHTYAYDAATLALDTETVAYDTDGNGTADFTRILDRHQDARLRPNGLEITGEYAASYGYDTAGRLSTLATSYPLPATPQFTYNYVANTYGLVESVVAPSHTVTNTYEANRNVLTAKANVEEDSNLLISNFAYTVNNLGQRTALTTTGTAFTTAPAWAWSYNGLGELVEANDTSTANNDRAFQYDGIGNRQKTANGLLIDLPATPNYTANALNQYTAIGATTPSYDTDGNATSYPLPIDQSTNAQLIWDAENRLIEVKDASNTTLATYTYDYLGRRISKSVPQDASDPSSPITNTCFLYDGWNPVADYTATIPNSTFVIRNSYTWGMDLSGSMQGAGGVGGLLSVNELSIINSQLSIVSFYPTYDGNGNVSEYLDSTGVVQAHYEYDAFGNTLVSSGTKVNDFAHRFSTKPLDAETGLYYYGYRYYDPVTGRWPSRDLIEEFGGINLYGMVGNDSVNWVDLFGLGGNEVTLVPIINGLGWLYDKVNEVLGEKVDQVAADPIAKALTDKTARELQDEATEALEKEAEKVPGGKETLAVGFFVWECRSGKWTKIRKKVPNHEISKAKRRAAREAQRKNGTPTSRSGGNHQDHEPNSPRHQTKEGADGTTDGIVDGSRDTVPGHDAHMEAGKVKPHEPFNKHNQPRLQNGKQKVGF